MPLFKKKKAVLPSKEIKEAPKPTKPAPTKLSLQEIIHERTLTAEGWRRRTLASPKKSSAK